MSATVYRRLYRAESLYFQLHWLVRAALLSVGPVLLLAGSLLWLLANESYGGYRRPVTPLPLNIRLETAWFTVLQATYCNFRHWPGCVRETPDYVLVQTSATKFEELVAYSRRLISPNDNDLAVLFVSRYQPEQPWRAFAEGHFPAPDYCLRIPTNCVAKLYISQGNYVGMGSPVNRARLTDLTRWRQQQGFRFFETRTNYYTDSLTEQQEDYAFADAPDQEPRISRRQARCIETGDAAYYSPLRRWIQKRCR